jgi:hypothetical protein
VETSGWFIANTQEKGLTICLSQENNTIGNRTLEFNYISLSKLGQQRLEGTQDEK